MALVLATLAFSLGRRARRADPRTQAGMKRRTEEDACCKDETSIRLRGGHVKKHLMLIALYRCVARLASCRWR
jgi:hypothetical protein